MLSLLSLTSVRCEHYQLRDSHACDGGHPFIPEKQILLHLTCISASKEMRTSVVRSHARVRNLLTPEHHSQQ